MNQPERFRLVRRFSVTLTQASPVAASANGAFVSTPFKNLPKIDPTQALRVVAGSAAIFDAGATHFLTKLGANLILLFSNGAGGGAGLPLRSWQDSYAPVLLGIAGSNWGFIDDEYIYGSDYLDLVNNVSFNGAIPGLFCLQLQGDFTNSDAAPHDVTLRFTCLVELYQRDFSA